ncbi:MAG: ABC transporter permease [Bacteroidota bacterium]|nr:ABC transporter permease [Bacteroidota bacterium]
MKTYTFNINLYDIAFFGTLFIAFTFAFLLWFARRSNQTANRFLAITIAMAIIWIGQTVATDVKLFQYNSIWDLLPWHYSLAIGPLLYFYVQQVINTEYKFRRQDSLHFVPLLLELSFYFLQTQEAVKVGVINNKLFAFQLSIAGLRLLAFISVIVYLYRCGILIRSFYKKIKFNGGDRYRHELQWLQNLLSGFGLIWLLWIPFTVVDYCFYQHKLSAQAYYPIYFLLMLMLIYMAAKVFLKPEIGVQQNAPLVPAPLPTTDLKQKGIWLKRIVEENCYYQDPELSLSTLAEKLGITAHELSRILNQALKKSFNDFINAYRVRAAACKMQDPAYDHITLLGIGFESGFNSESSFHRIFKQTTGKTPLEYKNHLEKVLPSYNLGGRNQLAPLILSHDPLPKWSDDKLNRNYMFENYFKAAWRNLKKNKVYSALNIAGLAIGIVSAALIFLWVEDEMNFNHNFVKRDYLYHVMQNEKSDAGINTNGSTPGPLAAALKADIPGIVNSGRLSWPMDELVVLGEKTIKENGMYADPSVLSMYALTFVYGDRTTALNNPDDVVISETMSQKFFGNDNPVGKTIKMNAKGAYSVDGLYKVTGVYKDLPANCYYHFQWLSPYTTWENANTWLKPWNNNLTETIVELSPRVNPASINKKLKNYLATKVAKSTNQCFLFSMNDWHLRGNFVNGRQDGGSIRYVRLFSIIAVIVLLIACINFMNLSTARSEQRGKEVGVLKVMGANKMSLVGKFISESLLMSFIAIIMGVGLLYILLPFYNNLVQKQLSIDLFNTTHLMSLLGIGIITGIVAGFYPAFYLSSFNPVTVLKGLRIKNAASVVFIRKGLVIIQFASSVILIISTIVVYKQVQHIKDRDLGYSKNNLIYLDMQGNMKKNFSVIKNSLIATGYIENAATSLHDALHVYSFGDGFSWQGKNPNAKLAIHSNVVSTEYLKTMHMQLMEGRDFYPDFVDSTSVIVNESMARLMGKEGKLGSLITTGRYKLTIVGIIKDFIYNDIYGNGAPLVIFNGNYSATVMAIRFKPNVPLSQALERTRDVMTRENPGFPFEYRFADRDFNDLFSSETLIGNLAGLFAMLAIFISCLGLFGLAAYTAERRTKEIGIRKVLGASVTTLTRLVAREFLQLVTVSCVIAFPIAWWLMHNWLQNYTYRTTIQYWMFAIAGFSALFIALITVSYQAIKAAIANPVKTLRSE